MMQPYQENIDHLCQQLNTDKTSGLTDQQYQNNLKKFGLNELQARKKDSIITIFLSQFNDPLTHTLFAAAGIIFLTGHHLDACIILGILLFNGIVGTFQEKRTEKILENLETFFQCTCIVYRNGSKKIIPNEQIVPGDIIFVSAGEKIPADARIITASNVTTDEAALTGESAAVEKSDQSLSHDHLPIHEQKNMLFAGTYIVTGNALAIVCTTGISTHIGKIYQAVETIDTNTPLKKELETLSYSILIFIVILCSALFIIGLINQKPLTDLLVMVTALFICVIPEGLPVVLSIIFISGAFKMAQKNVLVKRLKAVEALGKVNVVITDKTGTLTYNEMTVTNVFVDYVALHVSGTGYSKQGTIEQHAAHIDSLESIAYACALLNDTTISYDTNFKKHTVKGDPTQAAAFIFAHKVNPHIIKALEKYTIQAKIPFDSTHKYSAVFYAQKQTYKAYVLGAPEVILPTCLNTSTDLIRQQITAYTQQGYRVIALAEKTYQPTDNTTLAEYQTLLEHNMQFLGLLALSDEPRENLEVVIHQMTQAHIQIIMATGDNQDTAFYIANKIKLIANKNQSITGKEFDSLSDQAISNIIQHQNFVCARFSPEQKLRLVRIMRQQHKIIATTGDGVNDVPALLASDISIAMGSQGTQLTKQAADIILLNDAFDNLVYIIQEGKAMLYTLRRTLLYFLISNASEVFVIFFGLICNVAAPLLPSQILLLNLMTDGFLDAALATEETQMKTLSIDTKQSIKIFDTAMIYTTLWLSLPASIASFLLFLSIYQFDLTYARTLTFVTLINFQCFNALNCRSEDTSVFRIGFFSNTWLLIALLGIIGAQMLIVYAPWMHYVFQTKPLALSDWMYACMIAASIFVAEEFRKYFTKHQFFN